MIKQYFQMDSYESRRSIGYLLRRAGKLMTSRIEERFTNEDVDFVQWVILMNLRERIAVTAAELAQRLCHDSGALTRVIDQLEQRGWIARHRSRQDRRVIELDLTSEGRKVTEMYLPGVIELYNSLFEDFTLQEADQAIDLLTRLIAKLEAPGKAA